MAIQNMHLEEELQLLRSRLAEAEEALEAIRTGSVDALVVYTRDEVKVYTLQGAEHPYRIMVETMNEAAVTLSMDGTVLYANHCLSDMLGTPLESILGSKLSRYVKLDDLPAFHALLEQGFLNNAKIEIRLLSAGGDPVPVQVSASTYQTQDLTGLCLVVTNLSEHKRSEEILAKERMANSIIDQAGDAIVVCDPQGIVIRANQRASELARQNPLLKVFDQVYPLEEDEKDPNKRFSLQAVLAGEKYQGITTRLTSTGADVLVSAASLYDQTQQVLGCVITMTDITERRIAEETLRSYNLQLEQANRDLEAFAFLASHDLQEPLRKIRNFGDRLKNRYRFQLGEEGGDYIERMQRSAERMRALIDDLLSYSRATEHTQPFSEVDFNLVYLEVIDDLEALIDDTQGQVFAEKLPTIQADPIQMRQMLMNLISNGLKFHRPQVAPVVNVSARILKPGWVEIQVQDNGIGFDPQYMEKIFRPFERLHGRSEFPGSGIGLPLCRKIVERHGGEITATSIPEQGSTFIVTLPARQITE